MSLDLSYPEGATPIDPEEAQGLIPSLSTQGELNEFEALNISEATVWAQRSRKLRANLLSQESLRTLHKRMFDKTWKWAGKYRVTQKNIGCEAWRISTENTNLVEDVRVWIASSTYLPDEIAARFHHRLVSIHAYPNGNGRHARLATDLLCQQMGVPLPSWGSGSLVDAGVARVSYLKALRAADQRDLEPLIRFLRS
jgi:Fic-DOC domain mobile mystery protein B